jgi:DNA modification methylase
MVKLTVDPEIAGVIPDPAPVLESDKPETGEDAISFSGPLDRKRLWLDTLRASLQTSKEFDPKVPILVWRGKNVIVDGIQRYRICRELKIELIVEWMDFPDKAAAVRERVRRNLGANRTTYLSDFARAEMVFDLWERYYAADWKARSNKGGRGKRAAVRHDALMQRGLLCGLKRAQMGRAERIIRYARKPQDKRRMPQQMLDELLRRLRNGTRDIGTADGSIKGFDDRVHRKESNKKTIRAQLDDGVSLAWSGRTNVVINGDCLAILQQIPHGAVDRFVTSPPYYLADRSGDDFIKYGDEYEPFRSWDHYCNWTLRYLSEMWRILPEGGYVVINVDNAREPTRMKVRDEAGNIVKKDGKPLTKPNPLAGRFWYHTDMIRALMQDIDAYSAALRLPEFAEDPGMNPLRSRLFDLHPLAEQGDKLFDRILENESYLNGYGYGERQPPVDCGEFIWAKSQVVAKREATGSVNAPQRRPNNEYVLFWRKGRPRKQASTMGQDDLSKGTISGWEDVAQPTVGDQERWGDYWIVPASPDPKGEHAARFPAKLAYRMITFGGSLGDVICDPFAGTGTTLYVAARTGREYVGIELVKNNANRARKEGIRGLEEFSTANGKQA